MHRSRSLLVSAAITALAVTAIAVPVAAATGTIAVVNGIPGQKVDVCLNGNEIKSNLAYGGWTGKTVGTGSKTLKVRRAAPGNCNGSVLAQKAFPLAAGGDLTLVATKNSPNKVVVFDNLNLGVIPPAGAPYPTSFFAWRDASDLGAVNIHYMMATPIGPTADPIWLKGDQFVLNYPAGTAFALQATRPEENASLAVSRLELLKASRRHEFYLLGTAKKNAKFIVFSRVVSQPVP